jgi:hypothetical protein
MSTLNLFLTGKKVKLSKDIDLKKIINLLKQNEIDTRHIEDKEKLHSLFFSENDTWFLKDDIRSESVYEDSVSEEITLDGFLNLIDFYEENEIIEKDINCSSKSIKKSKYIIFKQGNISKGFKRKHILEFKYIEETKILELIIKNKDGIFSILNFSEKDFQDFLINL